MRSGRQSTFKYTYERKALFDAYAAQNNLQGIARTVAEQAWVAALHQVAADELFKTFDRVVAGPVIKRNT